MNHFLHGMTRAVAETFHLPGPILEIGSYQVEGQENVSNLRSLFPGREYLGLDMRAGPGVDCVGNVEKLPMPDRSHGTILALNCFEHVKRFWLGFEECRRVLKPDGVILISTPFYFKIHNYPADYWRFTPEAMDSLLDNYPTRILGWHGAKHRPSNVWALAFGENYGPIPQGQLEAFRANLKRFAREPRSWGRNLRYRLAGLLCGRGPFAPYLDHNQWRIECRKQAG